VRRVRETCVDLILAVGLVWLIPFVLLALLLPVAGVIRLAQSLVERV
jgi:hypothetical protein